MNHSRLRRPHHPHTLPFPRTVQGLAFPIADHLHVRARSDPHVQDAEPQDSLAEDANTHVEARQILSVGHSARDHGISAPEFEVGR